MLPIDLNALIHTITAIVNPTEMLRNKLARNETVIRLLKQFNLSPDSPPADFSGVYAYTLVEYGVGKPQVVLDLFRQPEIRQAFQAAWGQDNFSVLLKTGEQFLEKATWGDELRALSIDARQEFYQFAAVFMAISQRTRTPADVLTTHQLNSLHRQVAEVQDRLERLPTIEGIRTEMARLAAQSLPALPEASVSEQCRAFALAQQMRGWFETLGYRFESYEHWQADGFEWILNIPVRRGRYDRILVRGIEGEAELRDVLALRQSVEAQQTDEGWLVTSRRISRAARDAVEQPENRHLDCYTFDELVDLDADFTGYIEWLEAEIKHRKIDAQYVPLACTKEEIDLDTQQRLGVSRYDERDGWIDGYLDRWLDDPAKEHISILGEFGTGKTWVAFHYAWTALQRYQEAKERGVQRPRLPLVITLRDYAKALNVENVLAGFFFTQHNIRLNSDVFDQLNRMGKLLLIFDGFDEMAAKVDKQQMINNFWELAKVVIPGAKVVLTCRTEHFPDAREGRSLLNAELQASTVKLTGETPQFEVLELEKFNDEQIRQVMSFQASAETVEQVISNPQLLDLARRPVMTELILEALPDIEAGKPVDMSRVYLYAVRRKMERDIKAERTFTSLADKLYFLCELSWEMLSSDRMSLNYREFPDRIRRLFGSAVQEEKDLDHWHYDMMGQTMLIRNAEGDYSPAHRSLLEFFVAYKFASELGALEPDFLELAQQQVEVVTSSEPQQYTWSSYFQKVSDQEKIAPLKKFVNEPLEVLHSNFGQAPLTKAVLKLILPMLSGTTPLLGVLETTRDKAVVEVQYVGGNLATLLTNMNTFAFEGKDLSRTILLGADFTNASLRCVNFTDANLTSSNFNRILGRTLSVVFSPDRSMFATGETSGMIRLWKAVDNQQFLALDGHADWVRWVVFNSSGTSLVSCSDDRTVRIWDVNVGKCLKILRGHTGRIYSVAITPNNPSIVSCSDDRTVRIWNIYTGECTQVLQGHTNLVSEIAVSPDGTVIATSSEDRTVRIWDAISGQCLNVLQGHTDKVFSVSIDPSGKMLASGGDDRTVKLWNISDGKCFLTLQGHMGAVNSVRFCHDNRTVVSGSNDSTIRLWDIGTGKCLKTLQEHTSAVAFVMVDVDNAIASSSDDQTVKFWNNQTGECLKTISGTTNLVYSLSTNRDGSILASGGDDHAVRLWDVQSGRCIKTLIGHYSRVWSIAMNPDGTTLATASADRTVKIWNAQTEQCLNTLYGHESKVYSVTMSPDGKILASGSDDWTVKIWDIESGQCLKTLQGHTSRVWSVAISACGEILASGSHDQTIKLWDLQSGRCLETFHGNSSSINSVVFSPDGTMLFSGGDETIQLWNVKTRKYVTSFQGHRDKVCSLQTSSDGLTLVSSSGDGTIKLWDTVTRENRKTLQEHIGTVWSVVLVNNSTMLASGSSDGTIKLWDFKTSKCVNTLLDRPYEGMIITRAIGLTEAEKTTLKALGAIET